MVNYLWCFYFYAWFNFIKFILRNDDTNFVSLLKVHRIIYTLNILYDNYSIITSLCLMGYINIPYYVNNYIIM